MEAKAAHTIHPKRQDRHLLSSGVLGWFCPLKKNLTQLLQLGVIGYHQWQITANGGTGPLGNFVIPASMIPFYSVHAVGSQINYILAPKNLSLYFKYESEYKAFSLTRWATPSPSALRGHDQSPTLVLIRYLAGI